ncbi:hypothetical protein F444_23192 [Phytophthora nicotianae P1976]|uniref:Uncharacterized protein n=1 Tax=Phytophthora nicotianae P1976 TaxID=1317066 RepID=A0A080YVM2_PHYNI|nr:hypothetical protein F444_23192 [Phytophthora nicotianae P1976]
MSLRAGSGHFPSISFLIRESQLALHHNCGNEPGSDEDLNRSEAIAIDSNSDAEFSNGGDMESDESSNSDESVFEDANVEKADTSVPHRVFRKHFPKDNAILVWADLEDSGNSRTVHAYPSDLNSLEADASLTQTALDFFHLPRLASGKWGGLSLWVRTRRVDGES